MRPALVGALLASVWAAPIQDQHIGYDGIGPVRVGASLEAAAREAGEELSRAADVPTSEGCYHVRLKSAPSLLFMVEERRIVRVETADPRYRTEAGVRVGDSEATVRSAYGARLEVTGHAYDETGHNMIVRSADGRHALVMETDGKRVVYIRAGLVPAAEYIEGCL